MPGVRELFEQEPPLPPRKTRAELMKDIDADYYGYRDDDDGILEPLERKAEEEYRKMLIEKHEESVEDEEMETSTVDVKETHIPTQIEIQEALLLRKKQELLEKYC